MIRFPYLLLAAGMIGQSLALTWSELDSELKKLPVPILNGGQFQIPIDGLRHRRYRIWESPDLTTGSWELATTLGPLANKGPLVYQKPFAEDRLFFRIDTMFP